MIPGACRQAAAAVVLTMAVAAEAAAAPEAAAPRRRVPVGDFGALPGAGKDATEAIRAAIAAAIAAGPDAEVTLEGGEYRVGAGAAAGYCFPVHGADGLTIRGVGRDTRIVVTRPDAGAFLFGTCRRAAIGDVSIDYDPVPFCQGAVAAVDVEGGWFDLDVDAGYPTPDAPNFVGAAEPYGKWGMIMDRETRRIRPGTPDHYMTPKWEPRGGRVWRFFTAQEHYRLGLRHMRVGDAYVHLARGYGGAILAQACDGVAIERVVVHASPGLVVGLVGNKGAIVVRGLEARFAPRSDRLLTANADGVHGQQNRSGPVIEDCYFEGMADDGVNLYAPPNVVREVRSPTEWLVTPGCLILPGERLQVVDPGAGTLLGQVTAAGVAVEGRAFRLTLDKAVAGVRAGDDHRSACTLYNLDACGAGFRIRRNTMNGNRRYGCLLRAGDGLVEGNTFADTTGAGVVATNEPDWPEGPIPWGITVKGNRFVRGGTCLGYADTPTGAQLIVRPTRLGHGLAEAAVVRTVVIENNEFVDPLGPAIFVGGAADVRVTGNRVHAAADAPRLLPGPAVRVERCEEVTIAGGEFLDRRPGTTRDVETDTPPQARPGVGAAAP
jgi:hypothetical protein